jgi:hypothetical protein
MNLGNLFKFPDRCVESSPGKLSECFDALFAAKEGEFGSYQPRRQVQTAKKDHTLKV